MPLKEAASSALVGLPKAVPKVVLTITAKLPANKAGVAASWTTGAKSNDNSLATISDPKASTAVNSEGKAKQSFECTVSTMLRNTPTSSSTASVSSLTCHILKNRQKTNAAGTDDKSSAMIAQFVSVDQKNVPVHVKAKLVKAIYGSNLDKKTIDLNNVKMFEGISPCGTGDYKDANGGPAWAALFPDKSEINSAIVAYKSGEV